MDIEKILLQSEFFNEISVTGRKSLAHISLVKKLLKKEILFLEGDHGHSLFLCVIGNIQLYKNSGDGKEIVIKIIKPGELFGEVVVFEQDNYPVTARALSNSTVLMIPKFQFDFLLEEPGFRNDFIGMLMIKQRYLANQIKYLSMHDVEERFFGFIKEQYGEKEQVKLQISKRDIAAVIKTTPETLSRLILRLRKENKLEWTGKVININWQVIESTSK